MASEIDISAITASVISSQLSDLRAELAGEIKKYWDKYFKNFESYLATSKERYGYTKTLLYKDKAVPLNDLYVGTSLISLDLVDALTEFDVIEKIKKGEKLLISATAGSGKSFFAKYLFLALLASRIRIPLLVELRNLNGNSRTIIEQINSELRAANVVVSLEVLEHWLSSGRFCLILDGYDELARERLEEINVEIKALTSKAGKNPVVITSRPSEELEYLSNLEILRIRQLSRPQAIDLVQRLDYDSQIKELFLTNLETGLFERHQDFLSNPLLLTIMLMTYGEIAEIPSKMHVFYEQAFYVLFYRHDASKGMYRREIRCGLALDDFISILQSVAASGYIRSKASHSNTELIEYIRKAKKVAGVTSLSPEKYKEDLLQSVCILVNDGKYFSYNHRSFQEYFAALFLVNVAVDDKRELYEKYLARGAWDNALYLAFEINRNVIEYEFLLPVLEENEEILKHEEIDVLRSWFGELRLVWQGRDEKSGRPYFGIDEGTSFFNLVCFLETAYKKIAGGNRLKVGHILTKKAFVAELGVGRGPTIIKLDSISSEEEMLLENLGVFKHVRKRVEFLKWLLQYLRERQAASKNTNIESWL